MIKRIAPILQPKKDLLADAKRAPADADTLAANAASKTVRIPSTGSGSTVRIPAPKSAGVSPARIARRPAFRMTAETDGDSGGSAAGQREAMTLVSRLPDGFPFDKWDDMPAKAQLIRMRHTRLNDREQWTLLNSPTPLRLLEQMNREREQNSVYGGNARETTPLEEKLYMREWNKEQAAKQAAKEDDGEKEIWYDYSTQKPLPTPVPGPKIPVITPIPYPSNGEIAYVFYTNSLGAEFKKQAEHQRKVLQRQGYEVELVCTNTATAFSDSWNHMDPKTGAAVIISHCNGMSLIFEENSSTNAISATGKAMNDKTVLPAIRDLEGPEIAALYLYTCNAAHEELLKYEGTNVADAFRDLDNVDTVYAYDGSAGFGVPLFNKHNLKPRLALDQSGYFKVYSNFGLPYPVGTPSGLQRYDSED